LGEGFFLGGLFDHHGHVVIFLFGHFGDARRGGFNSQSSSRRVTDLPFFFAGNKQQGRKVELSRNQPSH
jgi:hypothetical protein